MSTATPSAPPPPAGGARIIDRGYRRYDGERGGTGQSMRSVVRFSAQRVLGVHRKFRFKVMPILTIVISYVPHMVYVGVVVLTNQLENEQASRSGLPEGAGRAVASQLIRDYPASYLNIIGAIVLFAAFTGPEVLCTDRRSGMFGLYMASPLNRWNYLAAKALSTGMILLTVTLGPPVLLLIGYSTQGYGPSGVADWMATIGRVLAAGVGIAVFHTMISFAISSITTRRAAASAAFIVLLMGTGVLLPVVVELTDAPMWLTMFNLLSLPLDFAFRVFGSFDGIHYTGRDLLDTSLVYTAFFGWIALSAFIVWDRYRRVEVTK